MPEHLEDLDVLIWLPGEPEPVLAGQVRSEDASTSFVYDPGYLLLKHAIPIFQADLPLVHRKLYPAEPHQLAPSLRDALPDRWGRRAIAAKLSNPPRSRFREDDLDDITVMLGSNSDRIGALEFRWEGHTLSQRADDTIALGDLFRLSQQIERGEAISQDLMRLIPHCASVGGARPKALYTQAETGRKYIAKFPTEDDTYPVIAGEYIAMRLAALAGLDVAPVAIAKLGKADVLLVERFDRKPHPDGRQTRRAMVSALTWAQETEISAHHISYGELAQIIETQFRDPQRDQVEMLKRLAFNILVGNSDDHARNHAAFTNGRSLELTPAYDIAPQRRTSLEAGQAMTLANGSRAAQLRNAAAIAPLFGISNKQFRQIVDQQVETIVAAWTDACDATCLAQKVRDAFAGTQVFNPYAFEGFGPVPELPSPRAF